MSNGESKLSMLRAADALSDFEAKQLSPLSLAYIGDSVFEAYVREIIVLTEPSRHTYEMHKRAIAVVNARTQAGILRELLEELSEEEAYIARRGRNAKPHSVPKNADIMDYKLATAFEALLGYLYITGNKSRLEEILERSCVIAGIKKNETEEDK